MTRARNLANLGNKNALTADVGLFNIGIGSTQPTNYKLDVVGGNAYIGGGVTITGNLSVGGTITYEDVTNVDAVGIITAAKGFRATAGGVVVTAGVSTFPVVAVSAGTTTKDLLVTGVTTATGDVSIADKIVHTGDTDTAIRFSGADTITAETGGSERLRITSIGDVGINGTPTNTDMAGVIPKLYVAGISTSGQFNTVARFVAGSDNNDTGAAVVINQVNDRGLVIQGGRGGDADGVHHANSGLGRFSIINNAGTFHKFMEAWGQNGQYIENISLFTGNEVERVRLTSDGDVVTQGLTGSTFDNDSANTKILEITGDGTAGEYGVINISGNQNANNTSIGALKFINRENSNSSSGANAGSKNLALISAYTETTDTNAGDDSGGYLQFATKSESGGVSERLRITGIGTAIFSGNIEVDAGSNATIDFGDITTAYGRLYADNSSGVLMGSKSNHALTLRTNNTERLKISNAGFIYVMGDGTGGRIDATAGDGSMIFADGNGRQTIKIETMASGQSAAHEFNSSGYFGVNTSTPACRLDVRDSSTTVYPFHTTDSGTYSYTPYPHEVQIRNNQEGTQNAFTGLFFHCGEDTGGGKNSVARISAIDSGQYRADIAFGTRNTSFKERMRITATGAVGIGTTIPADRFHVVSDDYQTARFQNNDNGANGPYIEMYTNSSSPAVNDYSGIFSFKNRNSAAEEVTYAQMRTRVDNVTDGSEAGHITFHTRHAGTFGERLKIESDGNVAVGGTFGVGTYASNPGCVFGIEMGSATQNAGLSWGGASYNYTNIWSEYGTGDLFLAGGLKPVAGGSGWKSSYTGSTFGRAAIQIDAFGNDGIHFYTIGPTQANKDATISVPERLNIENNGNLYMPDASDESVTGVLYSRFWSTTSLTTTYQNAILFANEVGTWIITATFRSNTNRHSAYCGILNVGAYDKNLTELGTTTNHYNTGALQVRMRNTSDNGTDGASSYVQVQCSTEPGAGTCRVRALRLSNLLG